MFRVASREGAVLLLDEADSFLRSRQDARQAWEVTQVNELLQQMEAFDGVFICTTNLMDKVDEAALRRFTFKVRFEALNSAQARAMFADFVYGATSTSLPPRIADSLGKLAALTPGDFATVQRQEQVLGERYAPEDFLDRLERECALKHVEAARPSGIGFLSQPSRA